MNTPPFISEVVEEFVRVYWGSPENPEYKSYISKEIWLTEKLTAVYEKGRADALEQVLNLTQELYAEEDGIGGTFIDARQVAELAALTTEGK